MSYNKQFEPFEPLSEDWDSYLTRFEFFLENCQVTDAAKKRAALLCSCGKEVFDIARSLVTPDNIKTVPYTTLTEKLKACFSPQPSEITSRHAFYERRQGPRESVAEFVAALRKAARPCNFENLEKALRDRVVCGLRDAQLQQRLLARKALTFKDAFEAAVAAEAAEKSTREVRQRPGTAEPRVHHQATGEEVAEDVDDVTEARSNHPQRTATKPVQQRLCLGCGGKHERDTCWAKELICRACGKCGHITRVCKAKTRSPLTGKKAFAGGSRQSQRDQTSRHQPTGSRPVSRSSASRKSCSSTVLATGGSRQQKIIVTLFLDGVPYDFEVDSGSTRTIISTQTLDRLFPTRSRSRLLTTNARLADFQGRRIPLAGEAEFEVRFKELCASLSLIVAEGNRVSLLGLDWFDPLGISVTGVNNMVCEDKWKYVYDKFPQVFAKGLGTFTGTPVSFDLNPLVGPIRLKYRKVPISIRPKIEAELDKLIEQQVLEPVPSSKWETPIVTPVKSDGSIRICADYKCTLNKALQQHSYPVPVISHVLASLGEGKVFGKLDLAQAYQQLLVDDKTAEAQTIVTHRGAFRVRRLQFGINVAPGIFQGLMEGLLRGLKGVIPYFDDVLIAGADDKELLERVRAVLERFKNAGLRLKKSKCAIGVPSVEFLGFQIDEHGVHPTKSKVSAIHNAPRPQSQKELQSFLGLLNFYHSFIPHKASVAQPLHQLLNKGSQWVWGQRQQTAFRNVKALLTSDAVLMHSDEGKMLVLAADVSPYGIGAVLSHRMADGSEAPVAYYSRSLSGAQKNYAQIDKEGLAIIAAVKKFHDFVYGCRFLIVTDHKPLLGIFAPNHPTPNIISPRMLHWTLCLSAYEYDLEHRPGKAIGHADALSLLNWVLRGWPSAVFEPEFKAYNMRKTELSISRGCILWGNRVVIPPSLRRRVLESLHSGHPGIVHMKALVRGYVWWPGIDANIEERVQGCYTCQQSRPEPTHTPPLAMERAEKPWSRLHVDFAGPIHGQMLLVVVDAHSKWLEVVPMRSTTSANLIKALHQLFATHGLPEVLVSDNSPQLTSREFADFLEGYGIRHVTTAPFHPASNGQAERMVRTAKESLARLPGDDWDYRVAEFLLRQHITPNSATGRSPAELLMKRQLTTLLDRLHPDLDVSREKEAETPEPVREFQPRDLVFSRVTSGFQLRSPTDWAHECMWSVYLMTARYAATSTNSDNDGLPQILGSSPTCLQKSLEDMGVDTSSPKPPNLISFITKNQSGSNLQARFVSPSKVSAA
ncbi:PREDICTED: uncharacterized protein K02A2.6-like [Gekko japonicus]|uniref:Gypsy retrotransposon integrase-like protein 1 n=1 Tax=Gekko japonicus TaxID=146911 RepID=A0ABM1K6L6_GEKJA|nr:PREDICTED: uncharacterized protein K02A2.6-like [Gekko japonicus]